MKAPRQPISSAALVAVFAVAIVGISCAGGGSPATSTPPTTAAPSPSPTPVGGGGPVAQTCSIGPGDANAECSPRPRPSLISSVESAIDLLIEQQPQIFNLNDVFRGTTRSYMVLDRAAYVNGLVAHLRSEGLCAEGDPDDVLLQSIRVKNANAYSEDFDLLMSTGHMRRGKDMYRQTCVPSAFPVDRPANAPPVGTGCYPPYPPPVTRFNCKVHFKGKEFYTLDSTPLVGPDLEYCASIGFSGRSICPLRPEGAVDNVACANWRVGVAKDTGRPGPTWTKEDGSYCTGPESGCVNTPDGQYQLWVYVGGTYRVAAENGAECKVQVFR
jgi:hypothetical protein